MITAEWLSLEKSPFGIQMLNLASSANPVGLRRETRAGRWYMQQV